MNVKWIFAFCFFFIINISQAQLNTPALKYYITAELLEGNIIKGENLIETAGFFSPKSDTIWIQLDMNAFSDKTTELVKSDLQRGDSRSYFKKEDEIGKYISITASIDDNPIELNVNPNQPELAYILYKAKSNFLLKFEYLLKLPFSKQKDSIEITSLNNWYPRLSTFYNGLYLPISYTNFLYIPNNYHILDAYIEVGDTLSSLMPYHSEKVQQNKKVIHYKYEGNRTLDLLFGEKKYFQNYTIPLEKDSIVLTKLKSIPQNLINKTEFQELVKYLQENYKGYPYDYFLMGKSFDCECVKNGIGYSEIGKSRWEKDFYEEHVYKNIISQMVDEYLVIIDKQDRWIVNGLVEYILNNYYESRGAKWDNKYFSNTILSDRNAIHKIDKVIGSEIIAYDKYDDASEKLGAILFKWIEQNIGKKDMGRIINEKILSQDIILTAQKVRQIFEEETSKDISWIFDNILIENKYPEFEISELNKNIGLVSIANKSDVKASTILRIQYLDNTRTDLFFEPFTGIQNVEIPNIESVSYLFLDPDNLALNNNRNNRLRSFFKNGHTVKKATQLRLNLGVNNADGYLAGLSLRNRNVTKRNIDWSLAGFYGFKSKEIQGEGYLSKIKYLDNKSINSIGLMLKGKTYHFFTPKIRGEKVEPLRYYRFNPQLNIDFKHPIYGNKTSNLALDYIRIYEENTLFSIEGEYAGNKYESSDIYRLTYNNANQTALVNSAFNAQLEYQAYDVDKSYLKLTSSITKDYKFNTRNSVSFRLWGGYFIQNTQRNSSNYADRFTRASLALSHQGFNDYAYDEYFHTRQDQSSRLIQQTSMVGGGFKTAVGNIQKVMMSNDFALALNVVTDIPIKILDELEIKLFGDIGYYKSKSFENEDLQGNYVYSTGLSMHIDEGLQIHLPLINSKIINDRYTDLDRGLFERISFTFDINHFRFWKTATSNVK